MAFPRSLRTAFLVESIAPAGVKMFDLKPHQLAIVDGECPNEVLGLPTFRDFPRVTFALGSPNKGQDTTQNGTVKTFNNNLNVDVPFLSEPVYGHYISKAYVSKPNRNPKNYVAYLGYNGTNECEGMKLECGRTYALDIELIGRGVRSVFGRDVREMLEISTPCCDTCGDECSNTVNCTAFIDQAIKNIYKSKLVGRFIKAEKVVSCCPAPPALVTTPYKKFCLSLCDEGDGSALARVQRQYQTASIYRKSRKGSISTYEFCQLGSLPDPVDFTQTSTVIPDCPTCVDMPGFTLVAGGQVRVVTIDNDGAGTTAAQYLAEVQAKYPTAISADRIDFQFGTSTYSVVFPAGFVPPTPLPTETTISPVQGSTSSRCVQDAPIVTPWSQCGDAYKVTRKLCLTMTLSDCNATTPDLADIVAYYEGRQDIVAGSIVQTGTDGCKASYEIEQFNNACLEDGCDTIAVAQFDPIPSYKGFIWETCKCEGWTVDTNTGCFVPPVVDNPDCKCGIKFTTAFIDTRTGGCAFDPNDARFYEPVNIQASIRPIGETNMCDPLNVPFKIMQYPTFEELSGQEVIRDIILYRRYRLEKYYSPSEANAAKWSRAEGLEYGVDVDKHYYAVHLFHTVEQSTNMTRSNYAPREEIVFYVAEDNVAVLDQLIKMINTYIPSHLNGTKILAI